MRARSVSEQGVEPPYPTPLTCCVDTFPSNTWARGWQIDMLAAAVHWADVATQGAKAVVGAKDLWEDISAIGAAVRQDDTTAVGVGLGKLMTDWSTVVGGCIDPTHTEACSFLDGFLQIVQRVALNAKPCETALAAPLHELLNATGLFQSQDYKAAVKQFAAGLDGLSQALIADACGLESLGEVVRKAVPKLQGAIVQIGSSGSISILVGSVDVYHDLYASSEAISHGDAAGFGQEVGALLNKLRTSGCSTQACVVLQGLMAAVQLEAHDFSACSSQLDASWDTVETAARNLESGTPKGIATGLGLLGTFLTEATEAVGDCGIPDLGHLLADTATKLGASTSSTEIGSVVQALVSGVDVSHDVSKVIADVKAGQWLSVGHDLGALSQWISSVQCTSFACRLTEGILHALEIPFQNLTGCETDLRGAEESFLAGGYSMVKLDLKGALTYYSNGLQLISNSVGDCGMAKELIYLEQEANTLGFGNVTILGDAASILLHGADIYPELKGAHVAFEAGDYRRVGMDLGKVIQTLSQWTQDYGCKDPFCYVVTGIMQFVGGAQGDIKACGKDFLHAFMNFTHGFGKMRGAASKGIGDFSFNTDVNQIIGGVHEFGVAMKDVAQGVGQCHLPELAIMLGKLGTKMTLSPVVGWLEELLHILIESKHIEQEIGDACLAFSSHNYPGFGFNLARLIKTLL